MNSFQSDEEALNKNPTDPGADLFSILGELEVFRNEDGKFVLRVEYPELKGKNEWEQSTNPATEENVEGYVGRRVDFTTNGDGGPWKGLGKCSDEKALICDAPSSSLRWMCIGCKTHYNVSGHIPGPHAKPVVSKVEMFVEMRVPTTTAAGDSTVRI